MHLNFIKGCLLCSMIYIPSYFSLERVTLEKNQFLLSGGTKGTNEMGEKGKVRENGAVVAEHTQRM